METAEADREEDMTVTAPVDGTKDRFIPFYAGLLLFAVPGAGILFFSYLRLSRANHPGDLYARVIKVRAAFKYLPEPGETPERITAGLKNDIPGLSREYEIMKKGYQELCYSGQNGAPEIIGPALAALPLKTALSYRFNCSPAEYARGWFRLILAITNMRRLSM